MKKIFLALTILAGISFVSCDPIEDDFAAPKSVTEETFDVTAKTIFMTDENGAEYAVGIIENHSPIPSWIEYNVPDFNDETCISGIKNGCSVVLRAEGDNRFIVHGINPDGSEVVKEVFANCPAGKRKAVLPSLENTVWEPVRTMEDGSPWYPQIYDYNTKEARFSDGEGVMGKWTQVDYDAKMSGKNVFIEFNHGFTGQVRIQDGWWSRQDFAVLTGDGTTKTYKVYMDPGFIQVCYSQDWSMLGLGGIGDANLEPGNGQDLRIVKMYTLLEL